MRLKSLALFLCLVFLLAACGSTTARKPAAVATFHNKVVPSALLQGSGSGDWPIFGYDPGHTGYVDTRVQPRALLRRWYLLDFDEASTLGCPQG